MGRCQPGIVTSLENDVQAAFRQHFVKAGVIEAEFSDLYGQAMDERHNADYELEMLSYETATENLSHAERFVTRVEEVLADLGALP